MNRKQRRAHARHARSAKPQSGRSGPGWSLHDGGPPLRHRGLEPTLSASADHDDHAEFRATIQSTLDAPHPAAFLQRVSTLVATATDHHLGLESLSHLIKRVGDDDSVVGYALLVALSVLAPTADDRAHAQSLVERATQPAREKLPSWLHGLTQARAVTAMEYSDLWWDFSIQAIELDIAGYELSVFLNVDHVPCYSATRANISDESIAAFFDVFPETLVEPGTKLRYLGLTDAGRRFTYALDEAPGDIDRLQPEPDLSHTRYLVAWAGRLASDSSPSLPSDALPGDALPSDHAEPGAVAAYFDPDDVRADVEAVTQDFLRSEHGQRAQDQGVDRGLQQLVAYGSGQSHQRLLAWGPVRVADFLLRHIPENVWSDIDELRAMPDLVRHWIRYINERCQMPPAMARESVERVGECEPFYLAIVESRARSLAEFTSDLITDRQ